MRLINVSNRNDGLLNLATDGKDWSTMPLCRPRSDKF
jgi:hypothetical protein